MRRYITGIGQDSHRFLKNDSKKKCIIGAVEFENCEAMDADSDGDVVLHAICNAITSISHVPILGKVAIDLCHNQNITDSKVYLQKAIETLGSYQIEHVALTIEGKKPKFQKKSEDIRKSVSSLLNLEVTQVGITSTTGDELTDFGKGEGLMCFCSLSVSQEI